MKSAAHKVESPEDGVEIWSATLDSISPNELDELAAKLDSAERARADQFRFAQDRHRYLARRGILRRLLGEALHRPAAALEFSYGAAGKPEIRNPDAEEKLHFNVSHAAGIALFALAWNRDLGIDLECASRLTNPSDELVQRILSRRELEVWRSLPAGEDRQRALLRAWARKEALSKATGRGLSESFQEIELVLDAAAPKSSLKIGESWTVYDLDAPPNCCAALAVSI